MTAAEPAPRLFNVKLTLPADLDDIRIGVIASGLGDFALATLMTRAGHDHRGDWTITWITDAAPDTGVWAAILQSEHDLTTKSGDWRVEETPDVNWLVHSYQQFEPFTVDDFFIYGSHFEGTPPPDRLPLLIDAATAFGSGTHGTTAECLRALRDLSRDGFKPESVLDMGAGSGILAVAATRLWDAPALAVDIEEEAARVAARHADMNGVGDRIVSVHGDGFTVPEVQAGKPFDLIIANILAPPLKAMVDDLRACSPVGGRVILSGMLNEQGDEVLAVYQSRGFALERRYDHEKGWVALTLRA